MERFPTSDLPAETKGSEARIQERTYESEAEVPVEVSWRVFEAATPARNHEEAAHAQSEVQKPREIVFLPGVGVDVGSRTAEDFGKTYAENRNGGNTYVIRSKVRERVEDPQHEEVLAIIKAIDELALEEITLVGQSQGGDKAMEIAALLGDRVKHLSLLDAVGLYEQNPFSIAANFLKDSNVSTPIALIADAWKKRSLEGIKAGVTTGTDVLFGMLRDISAIIRHDPKAAIGRIWDEVKSLARQNPNMGRITAPVYLISGEQDPISDPAKIAPAESVREHQEERTDLPEGALRERIASARAKEAFLRENVFTSSQGVRLIAPSKMGNHGVANFRMEAAVDASLGLIAREERADTVAATEEEEA